MLTKISRGICLHRVHTVSATITPNKSQSVYIPRDNIHEIWQELAKDFWPECVRFFFNIFFSEKSTEMLLYTKIHYTHVL